MELKVINITVTDELEARSRKFTPRKGDLSRIWSEGMLMWLAEHEPKAEISIGPVLAQEHKAMADLDRKVRDAL